jgi:hypothetical protein
MAYPINVFLEKLIKCIPLIIGKGKRDKGKQKVVFIREKK